MSDRKINLDDDNQFRDESEAELSDFDHRKNIKSPNKLQRTEIVKINEKKIIAELQAKDNIGQSIRMIFPIC